MKIRLIGNWANFQSGDIVDAAVADDRSQAVFYSLGSGAYTTVVYAGQFTVLGNQSDNPESGTSIRDLLGQDVKTIEFK